MGLEKKVDENDSLIKKALLTLAFIVPFIGSMGYAANKTTRTYLRNVISIVADKDKNGMDEYEWSDVYKKMGLAYTGNRGMDLSAKQLQQYLYGTEK